MVDMYEHIYVRVYVALIRMNISKPARMNLLIRMKATYTRTHVFHTRILAQPMRPRITVQAFKNIYGRFQTARRRGFAGHMREWRPQASSRRGREQADEEEYKLLTCTRSVTAYSRLVCKYDDTQVYRPRRYCNGRDSGIKVTYMEAQPGGAPAQQKVLYGQIIRILRHTLHEGEGAPSRTVLDVEWFDEHTLDDGPGRPGLRVVREAPYSHFNTHWMLTFLDGMQPGNVAFLPRYPDRDGPHTEFNVIERQRSDDIHGDFTAFEFDAV